ncbi:3474b245-7b01-4a3c-9c9f-95d544fee2d3 [Thermothielavioides terrestris]|uniref:3474b245-7b01-4a3c-9c9f-95d544fee2d3 n=1 Tax=Thermothielavioides terrestris TaxID=2587410 RepID=A0A446BKB8_9PEZI|nr:3474b245-7b01-4a3c-9c9f-95d544fee2d3 [Thermothielavioides terrestris]
MSQFGAPALHLSSLSPVSPVAASSSSSAAGGPAPPPPPSARDGGAGPGSGASAATPTQPAHHPQPPQHKRVYQACIPCRRRKVRCDLGSVDDPHDPPCVRCRRESKECYFSATRRKRKVDDGSLDDPEHDDYILRNGRKQLRAGSPQSLDRRLYRDVPLTPGGSHGRSQPLRRPGDAPKSARSSSTAGEFGNGEPNTPLENLEARTVMRREVYGPHDALDLLYKAATDNASHKPDDDPAPIRSTTQSSSHHARHDTDSRKSSNTVAPGGYHNRHASRHEGPATEQAIDPELTNRDPSADPGYNEALKAWARFRFVRAGWFTAQEAIDYIDYYYKYLSPLTPISPPTFHNPASHLTLLTEEPILTVTLLTIASRYRRMPGTGGHCRSHAIHEQLWTYLRGMIERVVWGQEAFGGGFCGSGADDTQSSSTAPWRGLRRGSLRTLGTIESLMILTEWHPRALHFPPNEATDELMLPPYEMPRPADPDGNQKPSAGFGGRRIESWLEPAWRSDRMCWMLLSTGMGLAYELGVFDDIDELLAAGAITRPEYEEESYRLRANRIKRLLLIYLSQLAGRLGWTNMVPEKLRKSDPAVSRRRRLSVEGTTPGTNPSSLSSTFNYIPDLELDDQIIHCWAGISNAMQVGNERLFQSRKHTTEIIQSGKYIELLKDFQPMLKDWWSQFERFRLPPYIRHILTIEYEYVRIYINSLSLQAVVERCTSNAGGGSGPGGSVSGVSGPQLSPQTQNYYGRLPLGQLGGFGVEDQEYVREVVNGSRNLLRTVVEGLLPGDYLKHAPVRTYFRIISGAMFLLKTFALGAPKSDVELSIGLMDRTVDALRNCVVDDVHLGIRFADMLETLTSRLRNRFIYAPPPAVSTTDGRSPGAMHTEATNGNGVNGLQQGPASHAHEMWLKLKEGGAPERSTTPANISATPWDLNAGTPRQQHHRGAGGLPEGGLFENQDWANPNTEMWYLPAGPAFFQNMDNNAVSMTAEGVNVGGMDLLEYMAMDPMDHHTFGMDGNGY